MHFYFRGLSSQSSLRRARPAQRTRRVRSALALLVAISACTSGTADTDGGASSTFGGGSSGTFETTGGEPTGGPTTTSGADGTTSTGEATGTSHSSDASGTTGSSGIGSTGHTDTTGGVDTTGGFDTTSSGSTTGEPGSTGDGSGTSGSTSGVPETIQVQIVAFNDFHGQIEPPGSKITLPDSTKVDAGGAAYFASHVELLRAENPNTIFVSAGDLIGASPLTSALFHDEPTIEVMNQIGLDFNAVGNHEFDEGFEELVRMQKGGCHAIDGCLDGTPFDGAAFQFLAANVLTSVEPVETLFPSYGVRTIDGVKIGFIGMTLEGTPEIVTPSGVAGLTFVDEAARANALVPELKGQGVETIVVLIHEGGYQTGFFDECVGVSGTIVDIVNNLDDEIDLVISGHTHQAYNCLIDNRIVTSAASLGRVLTDIDLEIDAMSGEMTGAAVKNIVVTRDVVDAKVADFVATYQQLAAPLANKEIGTISATLEAKALLNGPGQATMGLVIADSQLAATADPKFGGAQIAFMNPGGVRADLLFPKSGNEPVDGIVTYGEAFTVQPFGNSLVVMTLTGAQIEAVLEQQFKQNGSTILQVSKGFTYAWSASAPIGAKVDPAGIKLDGVTLDPAGKYRVTVNSFLATGGDGFTVLNGGTERLGGANDLDALAAYFAANSPVPPPALDRVTLLP